VCVNEKKQVISGTFPQTNLLPWYGKNEINLAEQKNAFTIKRNVLRHKINTKKLKPGLVAFQDIRPGNGVGLFSKKNIIKGVDMRGDQKLLQLHTLINKMVKMYY